MRRRVNGFDIFIVVVVVLGLLFLARKGLHHTGGLAAQKPVYFTLKSLPTQNSVAISERLAKGGQVTVNAAGSWIPMGTLESYSIGPYLSTVPNAKGQLVIASDPLDRTIHLVIEAPAVVTGKLVTINGNPFAVGQTVLLQEGGAQMAATIVGEEVR